MCLLFLVSEGLRVCLIRKIHHGWRQRPEVQDGSREEHGEAEKRRQRSLFSPYVQLSRVRVMVWFSLWDLRFFFYLYDLILDPIFAGSQLESNKKAMSIQVFLLLFLALFLKKFGGNSIFKTFNFDIWRVIYLRWILTLLMGIKLDINIF